MRTETVELISKLRAAQKSNLALREGVELLLDAAECHRQEQLDMLERLSNMDTLTMEARITSILMDTEEKLKRKS